ncbi:hypothetical protein C5167_043579 [Papaver somniferum]|uniref:Uncharacterized protein n=1 Tax=Papaver somniferum TaxID=3469 RepID=A0A4Y7L8Q2_PAPSO|nr:hypothetical protein C5167_043579 [Papaver somniferum]
MKELKAKEEAKLASRQHGLSRRGREAKAPDQHLRSRFEELNLKRASPSVLEINIRRKMTEE